MITSEIEGSIYGAIATRCAEMKCALIEIGGTENHVHAIVRLWPTVSTAHLLHDIKGASSHLATHELQNPEFKWQGSYWAQSVSPHDLNGLRAYIRNQKQHHHTGAINPYLEQPE
ncbi:MAG TPA: transposase [Chthonomonadales bacterium]|nr:transposase [Chthonomonadales bacterium]